MPPHVAIDPGFEARVRASFGRQRAMTLIGAELTHVEAGRCDVELPVRDDLTQQHGYVHGGIVGMIADSAGGYAGYTLMPAGASVLTVEYKINMLAPARGDRLIASGTVIKAGRTLAVVHADVHAMASRERTLIASVQQTLMVMHGASDDRV